MIADHESSTLKIVKKTLERLGYDVTSRDSPIDVLETFKMNPVSFDLVITDMTCPI